MTTYHIVNGSGTPGSGTYRGLWQNSKTWAVGDRVAPTVAYGTAPARGYMYECTTGGAGGASEPTWVYATPETSTTTSSSAVFTCREMDDWTNAGIYFEQATQRAMSGADGDIIKVHYTHQENVPSAPTYQFWRSIHVRSVDKDSGDAPTAMGTGGWIGHNSSSYTITIDANTACKHLHIYGLTFRLAGSSGSINIRGTTDIYRITADSVYFWSDATAGGNIFLQAASAAYAGSFHCINCTFRFGQAGSAIVLGGYNVFEGGSLSASGTIPTVGLFNTNGFCGGLVINGMDLSALGANPIFKAHASHHVAATLANCKLGENFVVSQALTYDGTEYLALNCSSGDQHYHFYHWNVFGETTVSTGIYATDADAKNSYDLTNRCSWKIVTSSEANYYSPYISPWFETYHAGTTAITPSIEVLGDRTGSPLKDDEIWGEWSYQGTSGSTLATLVDDKRGLGSAAADQAASSLTASDWAGETAGSPSAWFGKLAPASAITPAEIGMLRARVCVGKASTTVYVDPSVRYS